MHASNGIGGLVPRLKRTVGNHRGMVLMVALLVIVVLTGFGVALLSLSQTDVQEGRSQAESLQALFLADAAVERARGELNRRLVNPDDYAGQPDPKVDFDLELTTNGAYLYGSAGDSDSNFVGLVSNGSTVGLYRVQVVNNCGAACAAASATPTCCGSGAEPNPDEATAIPPASPTNDVDRGVYVVAEGRRRFLGHKVERRVEAFLSPSDLAAFTMGCGNPGEQELMINGNPTFGGTQAGVHSNCDLDLDGNPIFPGGGELTASGDIYDPGYAVGSPTIDDDAAPRTIPAIVPTDYRNSAYMTIGDLVMRETVSPPTAQIFTVSGFVAGNPVLTPVPDTGYNLFDGSLPPWPSGTGGWQYTGTPSTTLGSGGRWQYVGDDTPAQVQNRTIYFERIPGSLVNGNSGNVTIGTNPGTSGTWQVTIIAEGNINISGNPVMQPAPNARNLQMVAGTDIGLGGNPAATWASGGIIAAREQIAINGNGTFNGLFMVENAANLDNFVTQVFISGTPTITYSGVPVPPAAWNMGLLRITWRQLP